jgi:hypothetical protein
MLATANIQIFQGYYMLGIILAFKYKILSSALKEILMTKFNKNI